MTKEREARQWKKSKGKEQRKQNARGTRVTTPRAPPPRPSLPPPPPPAAPPLHRCPNFPPPAAPLSRRRWTAKSQALLGCTSHPPRGHPRATSASPSSLPP